MDPISAGLGIVGLGMQIYGGMQASETAQKQAAEYQAIAADEKKINAQKQLQMQLENRRSQLENVRNAQRARSMATAAAVNQGANFGSGLAGGLGQIAGQESTNALGLNQGLTIGNTIFGINDDISAHKMNLASLGADMSEAQGWSSLGGSLIKNGPMIGGLAKDAGSYISNNMPGTGFAGPYV